jgi:hypothetical protein
MERRTIHDRIWHSFTSCSRQYLQICNYICALIWIHITFVSPPEGIRDCLSKYSSYLDTAYCTCVGMGPILCEESTVMKWLCAFCLLALRWIVLFPFCLPLYSPLLFGFEEEDSKQMMFCLMDAEPCQPLQALHSASAFTFCWLLCASLCAHLHVRFSDSPSQFLNANLHK